MTSPGPIHVPEIDEDGSPWWLEFQLGNLHVVRCSSCHLASFPPMPGCPHCGSENVSLEPASGSGHVYSWVVVHVALDPSFASEVPYTVISVDLDEGARIVGRVSGELTEPLSAGLRVHAEVYHVDGQALLGFGTKPDAVHNQVRQPETSSRAER